MILNYNKIQDWFSELEQIRIWKLREIVEITRVGTGRIISKELPYNGGVYAFWWTGDISFFQNSGFNSLLPFKGPNGRDVMVKISHDWLLRHVPIPLYIGKNADSISSRIGGHLMLSKERYLSLGPDCVTQKRINSASQLRDRMERIFPTEKNIRSLILDNVGLSYVQLHGDEHSVNRFYLEDLAIGSLLPIFNVDIER